MLALAARTTRRLQSVMATTNWNRVQQNAPFPNQGWFGQDNIISGWTYRRIRFSWGFAGVTPDTVDVGAILADPITAGFVTIIGNGSEIPPNPVSSPGDPSPPTQRWLWWEQRQIIPIAVDHAAGIITWRDSGPQEVPDVKVNVLATGIPPGDRLDLWFSWSNLSGNTWDARGAFRIWVASSSLSTTP